MGEKSLKNRVFSGFLWRFAERCGAQLVSFVVSIVLARILAPEDYGSVALITVFTNILAVFIDCGLGTALIQKKNADDTDFSTVFYTNLVFCGTLYFILFLCAPLIAGFYDDSSLTPLVRVSGITLLISGVKSIQNAYVSKNMLFKRFFFSTLIGTVGAAFIGIGMALLGFGVWALVAQGLFNNTVDTLVLWVTVKWRPKKLFSLKRLKGLFSYGWKLLVSSLLDVLYNNVRSLIIGKMYTSADLAYYNKGKSWPNLFIENINSSIDSVLLPTMSKAQDSREEVKNMTRRSIKTSVYFMAPLMMGLCFLAEPIISLILTDKWLPCVPFMQIFCITYMFYPIHTANLNAVKALGRSDIFLKLEVLKKIVGVILIVSTMWFGVMAMAYSLLLSSVLCQIINSWPNRKLLGYGYLEQIKDILPCILLAVFMGACIFSLQFLNLNPVLTLCIQIVLGAVIYIGGSVLFKLDSFYYLWNIVKPFFKKIFHK